MNIDIKHENSINSKAQELLRTLKCPKCTYIAKNGKDLIKHIWFQHCTSIEDLYDIYNVPHTQEQICLICGKQFKISNRQYYWFTTTFPRAFGCCRSHTAVLSRLFYGSSFDNPEVQMKAQQHAKDTNLLLYGYDNPWKAGHPGRLTYKNTLIQVYGADNPRKVKAIAQKGVNTFKLNHNGATSPFCFKEVQEKSANTRLYRYGSKYPYRGTYLRQQTINGMIIAHNVDNPWKMLKHIEAVNLKRISKLNLKFQEKLKQVGINTELEYAIGNKYYDLHVLDSKLLIELNPTYTHNSTKPAIFGRRHGLPKSNTYHIDKTQHAQSNGFDVFHIFEWYSWSYIIYVIKTLLNNTFNYIVSSPRLYIVDSKSNQVKTNQNLDIIANNPNYVAIWDSGQIY